MNTAPGRHSFIHVCVGAHHVAVPLQDVMRAVDLPTAPMPVMPRRQGARCGLVDLAGMAVPVVSLDRWLPMGTPGEDGQRRILLLSSEKGVIGVVVDHVLGVKTSEFHRVRRIYQEAADDELFHSVVPALGETPLLFLLDVSRLMGLCCMWCKAADLHLASTVPTRGAVSEYSGGVRVRHAVFSIDGESWALPASCLERVIPTPPIELRLRPGALALGICQIDGHKVPLVSLSGATTTPDKDAVLTPWTAILQRGPQRIGLMVGECQRLVSLSADEVAETRSTQLVATIAILPDGSKIQVLNIEQLFAAVPEASLASPGSPSVPTAAGVPGHSPGADGSTHYLVFNADREYASPVSGIVGVIDLPQQAIDDLRQDRRAGLAWRGKTCNVVKMPSLNGKSGDFEPRMAVLVRGGNNDTPVLGIAIRSLTDWLPAHRLDRIEMRLGSIGQFSMVTPNGEPGAASLIVVDLAKLAYLMS